MNELIPFFCHFCDYCALDLLVMKGHMATHATRKTSKKCITSEKQVANCTLCSKSYNRKARLNIHIKNVHKGIRHICDQCGSSHKTRNGLRSHILTVHENQKKHKSKYFPCRECHKLLNKKYINCKDHIKTCEKCGYITNFKGQLKKHQSSSYCDPSRSERKIRCGKCSNTFTTERNMKKHELSHNNGKPHKCPDCGIGFTEIFSIKRHLKNFNCKGASNEHS